MFNLSSKENFEVFHKTISSLVEGYFSDLSYINEFQNFKKDAVIDKGHSLREFLKYYQVLRNIPIKENSNNYCDFENLVRKFVNKNETSDDVDLLVSTLIDKNISKMKLTSLCSKILFLNNPLQIFPMDHYSRKGLIFYYENKKLAEGNYNNYLINVNTFRIENNDKIIDFINSKELSHYLAVIVAIENFFIDKIEEIEEIRINRFIDKYLMYLGMH